jgi:membrane-bound lytic murein transglycosylase D
VSIVVPKRGAAAKAPKTAGAGGAAAAPADGAEAPDADDDLVIVAVPERTFSYDGRERVFYRTRDGDGLDEIAEAFGVRPEELTEWNNLDATAKLHPRMVLQVFVRKEFDPVGVLLLDPTKVRVVTLGSEEFLELETARKGKKRLTVTAKVGDTLAKMGRRYGLSPGDLARINRFSYNTELHEGQRIIVYSPTGEPPREVSMGMTPEPRRPKGGVAATTPAKAGPAKPGAKPAAKAGLQATRGREGDGGEAGGQAAPRAMAVKTPASPKK